MNIADLQNQTDLRNIAIDKVGVKGIKYPIIVADREKKIQHTIADLDIYVELPHHKRGTHMSRFLEVLAKYQEDTIVDQLESLLLETKQILNADAAYIDLKFPYFLSKKAPVSGIESLLSYTCEFNASYREQMSLWIGVGVPVTTLCPCSKEISDFGAHNQRSEITLRVCYDAFVWLEELIDLAEDSCSCEIYPLLKRVDEKFVTEKAYQNPMFVEDVVREISQKLDADCRIKAYQIVSENFESIHNHNAYAMIRKG